MGRALEKRRTNPKNVALFSMIAAFGIFIVFLCVTLTLSSSLAKAKEELKKYAEVEQQNSDLKLTINQMEEELNQLKASGTPTDNENEAGDKETDQTSPTPETPQTENTDTSTYTVQSGDTFWSISAKVLGNGGKISGNFGFKWNDRELTASSRTKDQSAEKIIIEFIRVEFMQTEESKKKTLTELREEAKRLGLKGVSSLKKEELLKLLTRHRAVQESDSCFQQSREKKEMPQIRERETLETGLDQSQDATEKNSIVEKAVEEIKKLIIRL